MSLVHPGLLVLLVLVPVAWLVPRRPRDVGEGLTRSLLLLGLVLALARPVQRTDAGPPHVALVLDETASVGPGAPLELALPDDAVVTEERLRGDASPLGPALARAAAAINVGSCSE